MGKLKIALKSVLVIAALLAFGATGAFAFQDGSSVPLVVGLDTDTTGNTSTSVGDIQSCTQVDNGATFDVDFYVKVRRAVKDEVGGIMGFSYNLIFDPKVVEVTAVDDNFLDAVRRGHDGIRCHRWRCEEPNEQ